MIVLTEQLMKKPQKLFQFMQNIVSDTSWFELALNLTYFQRHDCWCSYWPLQGAWSQYDGTTGGDLHAGSGGPRSYKLWYVSVRGKITFKEWVSQFMGEWLGVWNKQIMWTMKRFLGNLFVAHSESFPINPEKNHSFLIYIVLPTKTVKH